MNKPATIDEYIHDLPESIQRLLQEVRETIHAAVPEAAETINYGIPTFQLNGKNMIHFAGFASHIGLYATPDGHAEFEPELNKYKRGKGSVQFPVEEPIPYDLITRISIYRAQQLTKENK